MTIEEFKNTNWFKGRPKIIQEVVLKFPPTQLYCYSNKQCVLYSVEEPISGKAEDVTFTITLTGRNKNKDLDNFLPYSVFDVKQEDLIPWED